MAFGDEFTKFHRQAYEETIRLLAQQEVSALQDTCDNVTLRGTDLNIQSYAATTTTEVTVRVDPVPLDQETTRQRRKLSPRRWRHIEFFDPLDAIQIMTELRPDGQFLRNVMAAFNRRKDNLIAAAFNGNARDHNGSNVALGSGQNVNVDVGIGDSGLNIDKMTAASDILMDAHGDLRAQRRYWALHPRHVKQLFDEASPNSGVGNGTADSRLVSIDFNQERPLVNGQPLMWMGAEVRITTEIAATTDIGGSLSAGDGYMAFLYTDDAMVCGTAGDVEVHFDLDFTHNHALQVTHYMWINSTRVDESKVVEIECLGT